ncbi:MAG: hypothetical protein J1F12_08705 [Muribaculaceae bacterium]|nr:hypothetical protein [Muribaculaceae bacterium]
MKKNTFLISAILVLSCHVMAQTQTQSNGVNKSGQESFEEFRNRIHNNYNNFRQTILDHYADFLNGEWHEYESLNGLKRDETPKPEEAPRIIPKVPEIPSRPEIPDKEEPIAVKPEPKPEVKPEPKPEVKPEPKPEVKPEPKPEVKPEPKPEVKPEPKPEVKPEPKPEVKPEPKPEVKPEPKPEVKPEPKPEVKPGKIPTFPIVGKNNFEFAFYGIPMILEDFSYDISANLTQPSDFANQWKELETAQVGEKLLPCIKKEIKEKGLNDYLTYKYLEAYVNSKFPKSSESSRMALVHYLLVHLGYDARIAVTTKGSPLLLIPFQQTVYGRSYLSLQNQKYYLFPPEGKDVSTIFSEKVMTCQLPTGVDTGKKLDLVLGELRIPQKPKHFDLEYGPLHLNGEMNENLIPILYKYPQMPIEAYAKSNLQPELRKNLVAQVKSQLGGLEGDEDVEALLHFTQNAFEYATDDNYHGFEKPYFLEETLYYPKNDCEDRAIFYTYFLYNALDREAQLVSFPGHEAATVTLKNPRGGISYQSNGKTFYISDPTYIGASTGMVMPSYLNVTPEVDFTYLKK